jgi:thioredoxin-related protein
MSVESYIERKKAYYEGKPELEEEYKAFLASLETIEKPNLEKYVSKTVKEASVVPNIPTPPLPPPPPTIDVSKVVKNENKNGKGEFVFFSSDSCGFCKKFKPVWDEVSAKYPEQSFRLIKIQNDAEKEEFQQHKVGSYPTVLYIDGKKEISASVGYKEAEKFESFVKNTIDGKYEARPQRQNQQQNSELASYVLNVPLSEWGNVYSKLFTNIQNSPVMMNTMMNGSFVVASFAIRKGVSLSKDLFQYKL